MEVYNISMCCCIVVYLLYYRVDYYNIVISVCGLEGWYYVVCMCVFKFVVLMYSDVVIF